VANHPVRVVDEVLSKIDIQPVVRKYKTGGNSSYHPGMLLKVMVYAYINNIYSSRKIEEALQVNIHFILLSQCRIAIPGVNFLRGSLLHMSSIVKALPISLQVFL